MRATNGNGHGAARRLHMLGPVRGRAFGAAAEIHVARRLCLARLKSLHEPREPAAHTWMRFTGVLCAEQPSRRSQLAMHAQRHHDTITTVRHVDTRHRDRTGLKLSSARCCRLPKNRAAGRLRLQPPRALEPSVRCSRRYPSHPS